MILREYQSHSVADIRDAFRRGRKSIALVAPTGSGKTVIMSYISQGAQAKGNRLMILVHRQELLRQTEVALNSMEVCPGIISPNDLWMPSAPVQLGMVMTVGKRDIPLAPTMIIIDEFHHAVSQSYREILLRFPAAKILGLTATPQRLDGKGLGSICEELILGPSVQELIDRGFLSKPVYYAPPTDLDMTGVKRTAGDFNKRETEERVDRPTITGSAVEHYMKICPGKSAVAFCASVKHAEHVRDQFIAAGVPAAAIDGTLRDDDRVDRVAALTEGRIKVLTSVDVISEGFDLPAVAAAILLRPTESLALHLQQVGRVLRPAPGKPHAVILDHVGNCMRHGLAEEPRQWTLDGKVGKRKSGAAVQTHLTTCPECHAVHLPEPACPQCGHTYPVRERTVSEKEGSLEMLTMQAILAERAKIQKRQEVGRAKTKAELEAIARTRGYDKKWVNMMLYLRAKKQFTRQIDDRLAATAQSTFL